jgi:hypothetical protein
MSQVSIHPVSLRNASKTSTRTPEPWSPFPAMVYRRLEALGLRPSSVLRPNSVLLLMASELARTLSARARILLELLLRLRLRVASGSPGDSPLARARILSTSVRLTTPERRPLMLWPGN